VPALGYHCRPVRASILEILPIPRPTPGC